MRGQDMKIETSYEMLSRVAYLYYVEDLSQSEIAKKFTVDRTTISRCLKKARELEIVTFKIKYFDEKTFNLENELKTKFHLNKAVIVDTGGCKTDEERRSLVGKAGAKFLKQVILPNSTVGFSWGRTLAAMAVECDGNIQTEAKFVPLIGGPDISNADYHVNAILYDLAKHFSAESLFINASAVQENASLKKQLLESRSLKKISSNWDNLDFAFIGIGTDYTAKNPILKGLFTEDDLKILNEDNVLGDVCFNFYDRWGNIIKNDISDRVISINHGQLRKVPMTVGIAEEKKKAESIINAIKLGLINSIIITDEIAESMLQLINKKKTG